MPKQTKRYGADYYRAYRAKNKKRLAKNRRFWEEKIRNVVLKHYGGKCACCFERQPEFLTLRADGTQPKSKILTSIYYWLWKNKFPEGFQILCHNCNVAYEKNQYCPHRDSVI